MRLKSIEFKEELKREVERQHDRCVWICMGGGYGGKSARLKLQELKELYRILK